MYYTYIRIDEYENRLSNWVLDDIPVILCFSNPTTTYIYMITLFYDIEKR